MNCRDIYRDALLRCPSLFDCPLDVSCHLFAVLGNGYEWDENGELSPVFRDDDREPRIPSAADQFESRFPELQARYNLQHEAAKLKHEFVKANIERILDCPSDTTFFRTTGTRNGHYLVDGICWDKVKASAFDFPDNIQADWAKALFCFLGWWIANLRQIRGVDRDGGISHWEQRHVAAYNAILAAQDRLYPAVHGVTAEEYQKKAAEISKQVVSRLRKRA